MNTIDERIERAWRSMCPNAAAVLDADELRGYSELQYYAKEMREAFAVAFLSVESKLAAAFEAGRIAHLQHQDGTCCHVDNPYEHGMDPSAQAEEDIRGAGFNDGASAERKKLLGLLRSLSMYYSRAALDILIGRIERGDIGE